VEEEEWGEGQANRWHTLNLIPANKHCREGGCVCVFVVKRERVREQYLGWRLQDNGRCVSLCVCLLIMTVCRPPSTRPNDD